MRVFSLCILIPLFISCNHYCDNGSIKNGTDISYYKNKKKESEVEVKNCLCSGKAVYYNPDGTVHSRGQCINGRDNGIWNFYDRNGNTIAQARWDMGEFISYTILLRNKDSINFDNRIKRLLNNYGDQITDSAKLEVFNASTETELLNDSMIAIKDYRDLIIVTPKLNIKFRLRNINDNEFLKTYELRKINFELDDKFLRSGVDYQIKSDSIKIIAYYIDTTSDINPKEKEFMYLLK